jgi:hypothetical protein
MKKPLQDSSMAGKIINKSNIDLQLIETSQRMKTQKTSVGSFQSVGEVSFH